jgi:hypothetical protein
LDYDPDVSFSRIVGIVGGEMSAEPSKWANGEICRENPEKRPCFPRTLMGGDEYNQEEQKTATSARR